MAELGEPELTSGGDDTLEIIVVADGRSCLPGTLAGDCCRGRPLWIAICSSMHSVTWFERRDSKSGRVREGSSR